MQFFFSVNIKMPYKRKFNNKRKPYRRYRKAPVKSKGWGGTAVRALRLAKRLADAVNIEYKVSVVSATQNPSYNGVVVDFTNSIAQGTQNGQRIGDSVKLQNLTIRFYLEQDAAPAANEQIRIILYRDQNNTITTGANMLTAAGGIFAPISAKNQDNKYASNILVDRLMSFANYAGGSVSRQFDIVLPLNFHTHYTATTTTVKDNALKMLIISDTAAGSVTAVRYYSLMSYTDD